MNDQTASPGESTSDKDSQTILGRPFLIPIQLTSAAIPPTTLTSVVLDDHGISKLLGNLIKHAGLTPVQFADQLGISRQAINTYLCGARPNPTMKTLVRLLEALGAKIIIEFPKKDH